MSVHRWQAEIGGGCFWLLALLWLTSLFAVAAVMALIWRLP